MGFIGSAINSGIGSVLGTGGTTEANMINQDPSKLIGRVDQTFDSGQALQKQLQEQAMTGGGPLQTVFQNQLGQSNAQAAGLIASQKGINPGMAARLGSEAIGNADRQALGQSAKNQLASQQLASQGNISQQQIANGAIAAQNTSNAGIAQGNNTANAAATGQLGSSIAAATGLFATGGAVPFVPTYAEGGEICGQSHVHSYFNGGEVQALVSPGEVYLPPNAAKEVASGANPMQVGEKIPGKPQVKGNNYANDTVPKKLEAGGVVIPNSIMQSKDPAGQAHKFVSQIMAKQSLSRRRK